MLALLCDGKSSVKFGYIFRDKMSFTLHDVELMLEEYWQACGVFPQPDDIPVIALQLNSHNAALLALSATALNAPTTANPSASSLDAGRPSKQQRASRQLTEFEKRRAGHLIADVVCDVAALCVAWAISCHEPSLTFALEKDARLGGGRRRSSLPLPFPSKQPSDPSQLTE